MMKKINLICLFTLLLALSFPSCNNEEFVNENNNQESIKYLVSAEQRDKLLAEMIDTTVVNIETADDLRDFQKLFADLKDQELLDKGYKKIKEDTSLITLRASVQKYSLEFNPNSSRKIAYSNFLGKFSKAFCDENNLEADADHKISPNKTYICFWREISAYFNLASNQSGGVIASPQAALKPSTRSGLSERGYDAWVNAYNQYIISSHVLQVYCEDTNNPTPLLDLLYPVWSSKTGGYVINYAILTR